MTSRIGRAVGAAAVLGSVACGITDEDLKLAYPGYAPVPRSDEWVISTPQAEGLNPSAVDAVYRRMFDQDLYPTIRSLLVVRHGRLVAEAYARDPADRGRFHNLQSATKSVTSILAGIAVDRGLLPSASVRLHDVIPGAFDDNTGKRDITLRHALTMQTGLQFDNDENTAQLVYSKGSSLEFVLHRPLSFAPGSAFYYHDGNPQLVSGTIQEAAGMTEEAFAKEYLFGPLGISDYQWERHADGLTFGAFGLWLLPRDMAKIGLMLARGGVWEGRRVVSSEWLAEATRPSSQKADYGYYFWLGPDGTFWAAGHGGQFIYIHPRLELVVVLTADPYAADAKLSPGMDSLIEGVLRAVVGP